MSGADDSSAARSTLLRIVKLRLQLLGRIERDGRDEMSVLEEIEKLQDSLRDAGPNPIPPAPRPAAERRRYPRYGARVAVRYLVVNVPGVEFLTLEDLQQLPSPPDASWVMAREVHTTNVSAGGLAFLVPGPISRGSILWLEAKLPGTPRARAVASIARALPDGSGTLVGCEFFGMDEADQVKLAEALTAQYGSTKQV